MEDQKIIALFFARSEQSITETANKYGALCRQVANNILADPRDTEECVNDAYLGLWNSIPPQKPRSLPGYLCRTVRNLALKKYRANTAQKRNSNFDLSLEELENCFPARTSVEETVEAAELARYLNQFLAGLDRESRVLFLRRYWYSDSVRDLAALFRTTENTVTVRLFRLREKLKKFLEQKGVFQ